MKAIDNIRMGLENKGYTFKNTKIVTTKENLSELPLILKILSVFGGISTMSFVLFLYVLLDFHKYGLATTITGFMFIIGSILLSRHKLSILLNSFGISMFLCGLAWIVLGTQKQNISDEWVFTILCISGFLSLIFAGSYLVKTIAFITAGVGLVAFNYTSVKISLHVLIGLYATLFFISVFFEYYLLSIHHRITDLFYSFRSGSLLVLLYLLVLLTLNVNDFNVEQKWVSSIPFVLILLYSTHKIVQKLFNTYTLYPFIITILICSSAFLAPYILGGLSILLLSFYVNYKNGIGLGIITLIYFVSRYYYDLDLTLLEKSGVMFGTGLFFMLTYLIVRKKLSYEN